MTAAQRPGQPSSAGGSASGTPAQKIELVLGDPTQRRALIQKIQALRNSRVIVYVTADRPDLSAQMADDVVPILYEYLSAFGRQEVIDLFLHTRGGHALTPLRLAYLFREFCNKLGVLVPRYAYSAGTGLAIAADEIIMHLMGELGPIDPTVANVFNPEDPTDPDKKRRIGIAVEDVTAYLALARKQAGVPEQAMGAVFDALVRNVHPLALGNIHRQYLLIRSMSARLLGLHMNAERDKDAIEQILEKLTEKLYFHGYPISRTEARDYVGLNVVFADGDLAETMWQLYASYRDALRLGEAAIAVDPSRTGKSLPLEVEAGVIETEAGFHTFVYEGTASVRTGKTPPQLDVQVKGTWRKRA